MRTVLIYACSSLALFALTSTAYGGSAPWHPSEDHFYEVDLSTPSGIPQQSGTAATITGTISVVNTTGGGFLNFQNLGAFNQQLQLEGIEIHAYFPDFSQEVTSQVTLTRTKNGISLSYTTPNLVASDLNTMIVQIKHPSPDTEALEATQARIGSLVKLINFEISTLKNHDPRELQALEQEAANLESLDQQIEQQILNSFETVAETHLALQVDNQTAQTSLKSYAINDYRYTVEFTPGSAIQGESTQAIGRIARIACPIHPDPMPAPQMIGTFFWNGQQVGQVGPQALTSTGSPLQYTYTTPKLDPSTTEQFSEALAEQTIGRSLASLKSQILTTTLGTLASDEPVATAIAPAWLPGSTPDAQHPYVQSAQPVSATLADSFGRIDPTTLSAVLTGTDVNGNSINQNVTSELTFLTPDQGVTYVVSGNLNPLAEGLYTFSLYGQDLAGNPAVPDPLQTQFRVDQTPPAITLSQSGSVCTNQANSNFSVSIFDWSPITNTVTENGNTVITNSASPSSIQTSQTDSFAVQVPLSAGQNTFAITSTDAAGNVTTLSPALQVLLIQNAPVITLGSTNNSYTNQPAFTFPVTVTDAGSATTQVFQNGTLIASSTVSPFIVNATLAQGSNSFSVQSTDCAGNSSTVALNNITLDTTPPVITLGESDNQLTRIAAFSLPVTVTAGAPVTTTVLQNGTQVDQSTQLDFTANLTLQEGLNIIQVTSVDAAGNTASAQLSNITLDTIPPVLSNITPTPNSTVTSLAITVSGSSNEALSSAQVNGQSLTLSTDLKSFTGQYTAQTSGALTLNLEATDLAGNVTSESIPVTIVLQVLNGSLISVVPDPDGVHLDINGAMGAAMPGVTVSASASYFNTGSAVASSSGSFQIVLDTFQSVTLSATNPTTGQSSQVTVTWGTGGTLLSGVIEDTNSNPLAGATISIANTTVPSVVTDANGVFTFTQPVTGDQQLIVDGTTIPVSNQNGVARTFSKVTISVSIGVSQSNVLSRPIYLVPTLLDGSAPTVTASTGATVTDSNAPGVALSIPASVATFPGGTSTAVVSETTIPASVATIAPLSFAQPDSVVALEPSGTTFSQPVSLTLPNDNNLPSGTQLVIMSMNSTNGDWELDGVAQVSSDAQSIETLPGEGITHFSLVYAVPVFSSPQEVSNPANPGANTFDGTLSKTISLPAYKVLGSSVTPELLYKSSWAQPNAFISNLFDLTPMSVSVSYNTGGQGTYSEQSCFLFICSSTTSPYFWDASVSEQSWYQPNLITAQFTTGNIQSQAMSFAGNPLLPARSVISYAMNLQDPTTGQYFSSGLYNYIANYSLQLTHLVYSTVKTTVWTPNSAPQVNFTGSYSEQQIQQVLPQNLSGTLVVENEINSPAGRGWKVGGVQKLIPSGQNRALIEEGDGSYSSFVLNSNTMSTLLQGIAPSGCVGSGFCLPRFGTLFNQGVDFSNWPSLVFFDGVPGRTNSAYGIGTVSAQTIDSANLESGTYSSTPEYNSDVITTQGGLVQIPDGTVFQTDNLGNAVYQITSSGFSGITTLVGNGTANYNGDGPLSASVEVNSPMSIIAGPTSGTVVFADYGNNRVRMINLNTNTISTIAGNGQYMNVDYGDGGPATQASVSHPYGLAYDSAGNLYISTGNAVVRKVDTTGRISTFAGNPNGTIGDGLPATSIRFSSLTGLVVDNQNGYLYIADNGQNEVFRVDFATLTANAVAGNGASGDSIDGQPALSGSLDNPITLGLDSNQNLLIDDSGNYKIKTVIFNYSPTALLTYSNMYQPNPGVRQNPDGSWVQALQKNADGTWTRNYRNGATASFNTQGYEVSYVDRIGNQTSYTYDDNGNLLTVTDPTGRNLTLSYTGSQLSGITDPAGRQTTLSLGSNNTLTAIAYPDGTQRSFGYDANGLMLTDTDQRGETTSYAYNQFSRLSGATLANGSSVNLSDEGSLTALNNDTGDQTGTAMANGTGANTANNTITDANGNTTTIAADYHGYIETIVDPLGNTTEIQNDNFGDPLLITEPNGSQISLTYDSWYDAISQVNSATGITTSSTYDAYGNLLTATNGKGLTTTSNYGSTGLLTSQVDPLGRTTNYTYTAAGEPLTITNYLGHETQYSYDSYGDTTSVTDPLGHKSNMTYDAAGNLLSATDANGHTTGYTYDIFDRLLSVTTPKGETTTYSYLATGQLAQVKDPQGNVTAFSYDPVGRPISKTDPLGFVTSWTYDSNGNLIQEIDPNGNVKKYTYDAVNNLVQKSLPDNAVKYTYDFRKNMTSAQDIYSLVNFAYDGAGRLIGTQFQGEGSAAAFPAYQLSYGLDADGNRISLSDPTGNSSYTYDNVDRLTSITNPQGEGYQYAYNDSNGNWSLTRLGVQSNYVVDADQMIASITHATSSGTLAGYSYTRDNVEGITAIETQAGINRSLAYDADNQLVSATNPEAPASATGMQAESFAYDSISNRTQDQGGNYTYGAHDQRLAQDYRYIYVYDNNGNLISKQEIGLGAVTNYTYSSQNQLMSITTYPAGSSTPCKQITYFYDVLGRRIGKVVNDSMAPSNPLKTFSRRYAYDGQSILLEYDGDNNLLSRYTYGAAGADDVLSAHITQDGVNENLAANAGSYVYMKDQQGTVTDVADTNGNEIEHYIYSAFGELLGIENAQAADVTADPPLATTYTYTGREYDSESGLYYYRARYYDPDSGRFLQADPEPGMVRSPMSIVNKYVYTANNPFGFIDPTGQDFWSGLLLGLAAIGAGIATVLTGGLVGVALVALTGGLVNSSIAAFMNQPPNQVLSSFVNGFALSGLIAIGGLGIGALASTLGASGGLSAGLGAIFGAAVGGFAGYEAEGTGGAIAGAVLGGFMGGFSAADGAGAVSGGYTGVQGQMPVPNMINNPPPVQPDTSQPTINIPPLLN